MWLCWAHNLLEVGAEVGVWALGGALEGVNCQCLLWAGFWQWFSSLDIFQDPRSCIGSAFAFVHGSAVASPEIVPGRAFVASAVMVLASTAEAGEFAVAHPGHHVSALTVSCVGFHGVGTTALGTSAVPFGYHAPVRGCCVAKGVAVGALDQQWLVKPPFNADFLAKEAMSPIQEL